MPGDLRPTRFPHALKQKSVTRKAAERIEALMNKTSNIEPVKLLTRAELASLWGLSTKTLANWQSAGVGPPAVKLRGGVIRYEEPAVVAWYSANRQAVA